MANFRIPRLSVKSACFLLPMACMGVVHGQSSPALTEWRGLPSITDRGLTDGEIYSFQTAGAPFAGEMFGADVSIDFTNDRGYNAFLGSPETFPGFVGMPELTDVGIVAGLVYTALAGDSAIRLDIRDITDERTRGVVTTQFDITNYHEGPSPTPPGPTPGPSPEDGPGPEDPKPKGGSSDSSEDWYEDPELRLLDANMVMDAYSTGHVVTTTVGAGMGLAFEGFVEGIRVRQLNNRGAHTEGFEDFEKTETTSIFTSGAQPMAAAGNVELELETTRKEKHRVFTRGAGTLQDQAQIGNHPGFESDTWTGALGAEYLVSRHLLLGAALTAGENSLEAGANAGGADITGAVVSAYVSYLRNAWYMDARYSAGWMDADIHRNVIDGSLAKADTSGFGHAIAVEGGKLFEVGKWTTGPMIGGEYIDYTQDSYRERGAGVYNLIVDEHRHSSLESRLGWQISRPFELGGIDFVAKFHASWNHEFNNDDRNMDFQFETSPVGFFQNGNLMRRGDDVRGTFVVPEPGSDFLSVGASLLGEVGAWNFGLNYEAELLRENFTEHYFSFQAGVGF